ncbi:MAG: hypothetical protein A3I02_14745 [Betaproteobacteria bacterium RIFCSPLOWO2_02_FULL_67_26]|nr:MAG: hypothetical protein A3I02_14745 [Betaproteobacteria bacterium RIFCSPLOWO2_02_FULL_67_26]
MLAALAAPVLAAAPAPDFKDGLWRVEVVTESRGMKMKPMPPYRYERCYTQSEVTTHLTQPGAPCRAIPTEIRPEEMRWRLACSRKLGDVDGRIILKFQGERLEGLVTTHTAYPEPMEVTQRISGRRVGDCKTPPRKRSPPGVKPRAGLPDYDEKQ